MAEIGQGLASICQRYMAEHTGWDPEWCSKDAASPRFPFGKAFQWTESHIIITIELRNIGANARFKAWILHEKTRQASGVGRDISAETSFWLLSPGSAQKIYGPKRIPFKFA